MPKESSREAKIRAFDANGIGHTNGNLFGLPFTPEESGVVIIPVPWEVTVSSRPGTAAAPRAILEASYQIDLFDPDVPDAWKMGVSMLPIPRELQRLGIKLRPQAQKVIKHQEQEKSSEDPSFKKWVEEVNAGCGAMNIWVRKNAREWLEAGKVVGVLGGDHSVPLGLMEVLGERASYGVLHIDAHFDLRHAYEGFQYSHASIMRNAVEVKAISKFVHVAIRDYCEEEYRFATDSDGRHQVFTDRSIQKKLFEGIWWKVICHRIIDALPQKVYVSFDIDGLDPSECPGTGTAVPGGPKLAQVSYLLSELVERGREIIGFDLSEVGVGEWDANVGMRALYQLATLAGKSCGKI